MVLVGRNFDARFFLQLFLSLVLYLHSRKCEGIVGGWDSEPVCLNCNDILSSCCLICLRVAVFSTARGRGRSELVMAEVQRVKVLGHQMFSFIWGFLSPVWWGGTHFCLYLTCSPGNATFTLCFSLCSVLPNVSRPTTENHYCCLFIIKALKIMASICSFPASTVAWW